MTGGSLSANLTYVGSSGMGTFIQSGGTNNVGSYGFVYLGYKPDSSGGYNLSGSGVLAAYREYVGYSGSGSFTQSGGRNNVRSLHLGYNPVSSGTYNLGGSGVLWAGDEEDVGDSGSGVFNQTGGSNSVNFLSIGNQGRYSFSGGTLQVNGDGLASQGVFDATGSTGVLTVTGSAIVDLSQATLISTGSMSLSIGPNSLLLVPAGFNPATAFLSYSNSGLMHNVGTPLTILPGQGFSGQGSIANFVSCQGTISAGEYDLINLNGGVAVSGTGNVRLHFGGVIVDDSLSGITAGLLWGAGYMVVGSTGTGTFAQSGGTNDLSPTLGDLYLGYNAGSNGSYSLGGSGVLYTSHEYVAYWGTGTITQSGGTNALIGLGYLYLGYNSGSSGGYNLSGSGVLSAYNEYVGYSGTGAFTQSGGTNASSLWLGYSAGSTATYNLNGGLLNVGLIAVGSGTATLNLNGGTLQASSSFSIPASANFSVAVGTGGANLDTNGYTITANASLSGPGGLTKIGLGQLTLAGTNTYSGGTVVNMGNLVFNSTAAIPGSGAIQINTAGAVNISGAYTNASSWLGSGRINANSTGALALTASSNENINFSGYNTLSLGAVGNQTYTGTIPPASSGYYLGGGGGTLVYNGPALTAASILTINGNVTLSGTNTYDGQTVINQGSLVLNSTSAITAGGSIQINVPGAVNISGAYTTASSWIGSGKINANSTGALALTASSNEDINFSGYNTLSLGAVGNETYTGTITPANSGYNLGGGGGTLVYNGPALTGANSLTINGNVILGGTNTYTGDTLINGGTLQLTNADAIQDSTLNTSGSGSLGFNGLVAATFGGLKGSGNLSLANTAGAAVARNCRRQQCQHDLFRDARRERQLDDDRQRRIDPQRHGHLHGRDDGQRRDAPPRWPERVAKQRVGDDQRRRAVGFGQRRGHRGIAYGLAADRLGPRRAQRGRGAADDRGNWKRRRRWQRLRHSQPSP